MSSSDSAIGTRPPSMILPLFCRRSRPASISSDSMVSGRYPSRPSRTAGSVPWPRPVAASDPYSSTRTSATWASTPVASRSSTKFAAARMGPTVCELDGPMPTLKSSNTLMVTEFPPWLQLRVKRVPLGELTNGALQLGGVGVRRGDQTLRDQIGHCGEVLVPEPASRKGRGADAQTGRHHRRTRIEWNRVAVDGDADRRQPVFGLLTVDIGVAQVHQHQVHISTPGQNGDPRVTDIRLAQPLGQDLCTVGAAALTLTEIRPGGHLEGHRLARDDMLQRPALLPREDGGVELLGDVRLVGEDDSAARPAEGLVRGGRDDVGVRHR